MTSSMNQKCAAFETFGDCRFGNECWRSHNVWPCRTVSAVATIVTEDIELPGVIAFVTETNDGNSRSQHYYISRGRWSSADAASGDIVEISISENVHQGSGYRFARIKRIIKSSPSTSRISPHIPAGFREKRDCFDFITFKDCSRGARCGYTHDVTSAYTQRFHIVKVLSVISYNANSWEIHVDVESDHGGQDKTNGSPKAYHVPAKFLCNVKEGHLAIVQESSRLHEYKRIHFGKVISILHESLGLGESEVALEVCAKPGFAIVPPSEFKCPRRVSVTAYSMESCSYHENCQRIGVHIRAAALGRHFKKLDKYFVPNHRENARNYANGFEEDSIKLALTFYCHDCASDKVEGPYLTPVFINSDSVYRLTLNDAPKYQHYLKHMWPVFGAKSFIDSVVNSLAASLMVDFPKTWKERYVICQTVLFFNLETRRYLRSKEGKFVIVRKSGSVSGIKAQDVVIPAENLEMVDSAWQSSDPSPVKEKEIALGFLFGFVKRSSRQFWEEQIHDRYRWEVVSCDDLQDNQTVVVTSPIGQTVDFLNQQALLSLMISPSVPVLYSKNELLGIFARRYDTPVILKAVIRELTKVHVNFHLRGIFGRRRGNRWLRLDRIFKCSAVGSSRSVDSVGEDSDDESLDTISFLLECLTTEEYCNSRLVRLSGEHIAALAATTIEQGVEASKTASDISALISSREEYDAPYQLDEKGTLVSLGRGVELQLQVSFREQDDDESNYWLRLLRVGNDCHLCLVHLNFPTSAFFSGRVDVTGLVLPSSMERMKERIASECLKTVTLRDVTIEWNDSYFSGGTFRASTSIRPRNLLCIRKEVMGVEDSIFVWTCHAVVSEVCNGQVKFLVCSLYQDLTPEVWNQIEDGNFIVEVIDVEEENILDL